MPADSATGRALRKSAFVQTAFEVREHLYALMPFWRTFGDSRTDSGVPFASAGSALLQVLLTPPGSQPDDERCRQFRAAAALTPSDFYDRLILRQLAEEANTLGDAFELTRTLQTFIALHIVGGGADLLARLTAAVATRKPLEDTVLRVMADYLRFQGGGDAELATEMTRAFASVGVPVPDWVQIALNGAGISMR
jgi:hypothetical protein